MKPQNFPLACPGTTRKGSRCRSLDIFENGRCKSHGGEGKLIARQANRFGEHEPTMLYIRRAADTTKDEALKAKLRSILDEYRRKPSQVPCKA